jgi:hypothetical protein
VTLEARVVFVVKCRLRMVSWILAINQFAFRSLTFFRTACRCQSSTGFRQCGEGSAWGEPAALLAAANQTTRRGHRSAPRIPHMYSCIICHSSMGMRAVVECFTSPFKLATCGLGQQWSNACFLLVAAEVQPAFDAAAVQTELREQQPDVVAAAQSFAAPTAVSNMRWCDQVYVWLVAWPHFLTRLVSTAQPRQLRWRDCEAILNVLDGDQTDGGAVDLPGW